MHTHPPMVLVSLGSTRLRMALPGGKTTILDLDPGKTGWVEGAHHGWEILAGELRAVGVEIKSAQAGKVPPAPQRKANDAVATDPDAHHLLFENSHVRVFEGRTSIGRRSPMHSHPPSAMVSLDWMRLKLTLPDGKTVPALAVQVASRGMIMKAWLTDDARRLPVQLEVPLPFGVVALNLVEYQRGR